MGGTESLLGNSDRPGGEYEDGASNFGFVSAKTSATRAGSRDDAAITLRGLEEGIGRSRNEPVSDGCSYRVIPVLRQFCHPCCRIVPRAI